MNNNCCIVVGFRYLPILYETILHLHSVNMALWHQHNQLPEENTFTRLLICIVFKANKPLMCCCMPLN